MLGSNSNPTAQQLYGILRQMVVLTGIEPLGKTNCKDNLNILIVSSGSTQNEIPSNVNRQMQFTDEKFDLFSNLKLNFNDLYTIELRAGTIEKKIRRAIPCCSHPECKNIFANNCDKVDGTFFENGLAQRPTKSTVSICEIVHKFFLIHNDIYKFIYNEFYADILNTIPFDNLYLHIHFSHDLKHKSQFILLIIDEYIRMHATYIARTTTIKIHTIIYGKTDQKLKHFAGQ